MKVQTLGGIIGAVAMVVVALINSCTEKPQQVTAPAQITLGNLSPNISNSSNVTINYGVKDCYLDQWAQLMREQGKNSQQIDNKINEISRNLSHLNKQLSGQAITRVEAERILRYIELGDYRAAEILIKQSSVSLKKVVPQAIVNKISASAKSAVALNVENSSGLFNPAT